MASLIKFLIIVAIIFFVAKTARKKNPASRNGKTASDNDGSGHQRDGSSPSAADRQDDFSFCVPQWEKTARELSASLIQPSQNPSGNLAITGRVNDLPYRIELIQHDRKVFYALTLPFEPKLKNRSFVIRCVSDRAYVAKNRIMILCPGVVPEPAVIKEMAAHAGRLLMTIPFENEAAEDKPESAFLRRQNADPSGKTPPAPAKPEPVVIPEPEPVVIPEPEPIVTPEPKPVATPEPEPIVTPEPKPVATPEPEPVTPGQEPASVEERQEESPAPAADKAEKENEGDLTPESLAEVLFRSTLPGPAEKEYFASLTGRRVEWTGTVRMAYEISSDFVFGRVKGVKVQMELCTIAGKYGRQTLRGTAVFPPESYAVLRKLSNKEIRFRGTILKLESFSREVYLSEGELL